MWKWCLTISVTVTDCAGCGGVLDAYPRADGHKRSVCKACTNEQVTLNRYKMTREQLSGMRESQGNRCAICREDRKLVIDHDHACCPSAQGRSRSCGGCVRGLLCHRCNVGLAYIEGTYFDKAVTYLNLYGL